MISLAAMAAGLCAPAQEHEPFTAENLGRPSQGWAYGPFTHRTMLKSLIEEDMGFEVEGYPTIFYGMVGLGMVPERSMTFDPGPFGGMLSAVQIAYTFDMPLIFTPDDVWLAITQAFARHLRADPAQARRLPGSGISEPFTAHVPEGFPLGRMMAAENDDALEWIWEDESLSQAWEEAILQQLSAQVEERLGTKLAATLTAPFSTSTLRDIIAFNTPFASRKIYRFPDKGFTVIRGSSGSGGLPFPPKRHHSAPVTDITLAGTTADWMDVLMRTRALSRYGLEWWTSQLIPVLEQFVKTSRGEFDRAFWDRMYIHRLEPDWLFCEGWILKFYPYDDKNSRLSMIDVSSGFYSNNLDGLWCSDLRMVSAGGRADTLELWAGEMGAQIVASSRSGKSGMSPFLGWMVRRKDDRVVSLRDYFVYKQEDTRTSFKLDFAFKGEIPEPVMLMPHINYLDVWLDTTVRLIPAELAKIPIKRMDVHEYVKGVGELDSLNVKHLREKFPSTQINILGPMFTEDERK